MNVLVLQHIACEPPGAYEDVLRERGAAIHRVELDEMLTIGRTLFEGWLDHVVAPRLAA